MKTGATSVPGIILVFSLVFGASAASAEPLTVSAAISLKNVFEEIGKEFEAQNKDASVRFNFGASGVLMAQISEGAPADVFASAAIRYMDELDREGIILKDTKSEFAVNSVVLIKPASSEIQFSGFEDLKKSEVKTIAMGNPKSSPAGRYADQVLHYFRIADVIREKLVLAENVRQVLEYVARGEADAGIVYGTDVRVRRHELSVVAAAPVAGHKPIIYPIAVVKGTRNEKAARAFVSFVLSDEGKRILEKHGFKTGR